MTSGKCPSEHVSSGCGDTGVAFSFNILSQWGTFFEGVTHKFYSFKNCMALMNGIFFLYCSVV